ncbi:MAG: amidohydrolase [Aequoribacter sp.]|uniref:amidohydrolase n=1 Tax=Aequoribacter sp. TaxID=2847771 RepID=UPI003C6761F0
MKYTSLLAALVLTLAGCSKDAMEPAVVADTVFIGNNIITMDEATEGAEAVALKDGKILVVGSRQAATAHIGESTEVIQLGDKALVPGFIDAHGHFSFVGAMADMVNLNPPPVGPVTNIASLQQAIRDFITERDLEEDQWIYGFGYDDSLLAEGRHPTRHDLDEVSTDIPIVITHVSGHLASANTKALDRAGITVETQNPPGGVIRREADGKTPNGVLEESATYKIRSSLASISSDELDGFSELVDRAVYEHVKNGLTTVQEGGANPTLVGKLRAVAAQKPLPVDLVAFPIGNGLESEALENFDYQTQYKDGIRVGGVKFMLDGSPQGRTAYMREPYDEPPQGVPHPKHYVAYPNIPLEAYEQRAQILLENKVPFITHANGDAAIDMVITAHDDAGITADDDRRSVVIHAQLTRPDHLAEYKRLGLVPSYFVAHTFFWGDWHRISFGDERALHISPLKSSQDLGIHYTVHNDSPVVPPNMMRLWWTGVERQTRSGFVLGADQRASPREVLYAMTQGGAYQYFEEDIKGSLTPGKQADLVILSEDPLAENATDLKDIAVLQTWARGKKVFEQ